MKKSKKAIKIIKGIALKKSDLAFVVDLLSISIKNGQHFISAINSLKDFISEPLAGEFQIIVQEHKLGLPVDEALINFANRLKIPAIHQLIQATLFSLNSGSNAPALLHQTAKDIRDDLISLKYDKSLFDLKAYHPHPMSHTQTEKNAKMDNEILRVDKSYLRSHESISFFKHALLIGKNVLVVCHDSDLTSLVMEHFNEFKCIDMEKENVAQTLLDLSDSPGEKGKLLFIRASTIRNGFQRLKSILAMQERNSNASSVKILLDLFSLIHLQISFTTNKTKQSWISEVSELRMMLENGSLLLEPIFIAKITGINKDYKFLGYLRPTGYIPNIFEEIERNGDDINIGIFS